LLAAAYQKVMPPAFVLLKERLGQVSVTRRGLLVRYGLLGALHTAALATLVATEQDLTGAAAFVLTWGLFNVLWLMLLARPAAAAALSLAMMIALILLSQLKQNVVFMTVNFVDLLIVDWDTAAYLISVYPDLGRRIGLAALLAIPTLALVWWFDPLRVRRRTALLGGLACLVGLTALSYGFPTDPYDEFYRFGYVSKFGRSGVTAVGDYFTRGLLESDASASERLDLTADGVCQTATKPPHIILIHDESSFDLTVAPGIKVQPGYQGHFASFDGKHRALVVEGSGGPSWFTEYNVLTGLSARSYGRFADFLTRIAADRVERGLPNTLRRCGYRTFTLFPFLGAFLATKRFQMSVGIEKFSDIEQVFSPRIEPDAFYYDNTARLIAQEREAGPVFLYTYVAANHFPWTFNFRQDLTPQNWRDPGNGMEADEYLRRQAMSVRDYRDFLARLKREFPGDSFLIVRYGDHQPSFARHLMDPAFDDSALSRRIADYDPRFLTTYYAIETLNYQPVDLSSALDTLDAPYLPLVILEAAGVSLDAAFAEQKKILQRCRGEFYRCGKGAEARRFNRMLIDAGLIKGL
jgi:hypothetical protein